VLGGGWDYLLSDFLPQIVLDTLRDLKEHFDSLSADFRHQAKVYTPDDR
jgi:hypothetical protein